MSCIYLIVNNINGKCYAGQTKDIKKRQHFKSAWYKKCSSYNTLIYRAIRRYGNNSFSIYIFAVPESFRDEGETILIEMYNCLTPFGYNIETGGCGHKIMAEETKKKISKANKNQKRGAYKKEREILSKKKLEKMSPQKRATWEKILKNAEEFGELNRKERKRREKMWAWTLSKEGWYATF